MDVLLWVVFRSGILKYSRSIGFLCGRESPAMIKAHVEAAYIMGEPFAEDVKTPFFSTSFVFVCNRLFIHITSCVRVRVRVYARTHIDINTHARTRARIYTSTAVI